MLRQDGPVKIVVMVSGGGTNLQAIIDSIKDGKITNAEIAGVISNNKNAYALKRAEENNIPGVCVSPPSAERAIMDLRYTRRRLPVE